jgi:peptidoglycan-associated lipoprotein
MTARFLALATLASATVLLAACGTTKLPEPAAAVPVETRTPAANTAAAAPGPTANATPQSQVASIDLAKDAAARAAAAGAGAALLTLPTQRVVYFDFDSYVIKDDFKPLLDNYAKVLTANKGKKLVIEGHTDERGGREYNVALGQKRAAAVVKSLTLLGATDAQLEAVSFGEERPASAGHDESAWAKNRRAELKDR